jgi:hypothetical protein
VVVLDDEIDMAICPSEKPLQLPHRVLEQRKVVEVYVQNDRHRFLAYPWIAPNGAAPWAAVVSETGVVP